MESISSYDVVSQTEVKPQDPTFQPSTSGRLVSTGWVPWWDVEDGDR